VFVPAGCGELRDWQLLSVRGFGVMMVGGYKSMRRGAMRVGGALRQAGRLFAGLWSARHIAKRSQQQCHNPSHSCL
jgi:hypothetical protein